MFADVFALYGPQIAPAHRRNAQTMQDFKNENCAEEIKQYYLKIELSAWRLRGDSKIYLHQRATSTDNIFVLWIDSVKK